MPEETAEKLPAHRRADLQFKPGQSGNPAGRPKGARSKLGEAFLKAMLDDFGVHGVEAVEKVRTERPADYLKVVASILPKELAFDEEALQALVQVAFIGRKQADVPNAAHAADAG